MGHSTKKELYNSISLDMLCDFVYHYITKNMEKKPREEFEEALAVANIDPREQARQLTTRQDLMRQFEEAQEASRIAREKAWLAQQ